MRAHARDGVDTTTTTMAVIVLFKLQTETALQVLTGIWKVLRKQRTAQHTEDWPTRFKLSGWSIRAPLSLGDAIMINFRVKYFLISLPIVAETIKYSSQGTVRVIEFVETCV